MWEEEKETENERERERNRRMDGLKQVSVLNQVMEKREKVLNECARKFSPL